MKLTGILTSEQITAIQKHIDSKTYSLDYDQRDELTLSKKQLENVLETHGVQDIESNFLDCNLEYVCQIEQTAIFNAIEWITDKDTVKLIKEDYIDVCEYFSVCIDTNLQAIIPYQNAVITLYSNYDCINSWHYETSNGLTYKDSYFGACIDVLRLNPQLVKKELTKRGVKCFGVWPNKSNRDAQALVKIDAFINEFETCQPECNLRFVFKLDVTDMNGEVIKEITLHKGSSIGFYDYGNGGGSMFNLILEKDFKIKLGQFGKTKYDHLALNFDKVLPYRENYSIVSCFGEDTVFESKAAILHF